MQYKITTFYQFHPFSSEDVTLITNELTLLAKKQEPGYDLKGLVIIGKEGFNSTVSGTTSAITALKEYIQSLEKKYSLKTTIFKDSTAHFQPFRMFKVKERKEIVTLGDESILPNELSENTHLPPEIWDKMLEQEDVVCIDTRNWYETNIGKFKTAIAPDIDDFQEFPEFLKKSNIPKDKKILMYCTGGIRCEKAIIDAKQQGFKEVYQLEGGILNYFEKKPQSQFEGECFVFDNRVAVDQDLQPSKKFKLCPHCGQPAKTEITCLRCDTLTIVCDSCLQQKDEYKTCSKNCSYHFKRAPEKKGGRQVQGFRVKMQDQK